MMRVGHGFDAHRLVEGRALVLGGVRIPFERGALGHSDADVLAHAIADALLGAAALERSRGAFSRQRSALEGCRLDGRCSSGARAAVREAGFAIVNVDATIVVDRPKLAPFIDAMRDEHRGAAGDSARRASASRPRAARAWVTPATAPASPPTRSR